MSKLWIVHRDPQQLSALARIAGWDEGDVSLGRPEPRDFTDAPTPAVVILGVEGDFERELEFVHRTQARAGRCAWILVAATEDAAEAARLFDLVEPEVLERSPSARVLRGKIAHALARRRAESLAERQSRQRVAERFSSWFGGIEIPGLLRALDPSLCRLPLLIRGTPGSGRQLLVRYVELFRAGDGIGQSQRSILRVHATDRDVGGLVAQIASHHRSVAPGHRREPTVWIDEIDRLPPSDQNALAGWIADVPFPNEVGLASAHWIATAGPSTWQNPLEPALERAFAPLALEIPALRDDPDSIPTFAREVAADWSRSIGGPARELSEDALAELARQAWQGDRSELEAVLRSSFATTSRNPLDVQDLRLSLTQPEARQADAISVADVPADAPRTESVDAPSVESEAETSTEVPIIEVIAQPETDEEMPSDAEIVGREEGTPDADSQDWPALPPIDPESPAQPTITPQGPPAIKSSDEEILDDSLLLRDASFDIAKQPDAGMGANGSTAADAKSAEPDAAWRRLARSLTHEIRNPLVSIRSFAELLPENFEDETFRARFSDLVGRDVDHISDVLTRMQSVAERDETQVESVDVSAMVEELLEERRERIAQHRLLVLRELDRDSPLVLADPIALRVALAGLIDRTLDALPERGDLFVATRHVERSQSGEPRMRVLLRHHHRGTDAGLDLEADELSPEANMLEYVLAETVARGAGGSLTIDSSGAQETLILVELRTPY